MCVKNIILLEGEGSNTATIFNVDGTSYAPEGNVHGLEKLTSGDKLADNVKRFAQCMALCNESKLFMDKGRV